MPDRHFINGTALDTYAETFDWDGLNLPDLSGADVSLPYGVGEVPGNRTLKGRDYSLSLRVIGDDRADYLTKAEALLALVFQDGATFTLSRELTVNTGLRTDEALARYVSCSGFRDLSERIGEVLVRFRLLDGVFTVVV